MMLELRKHPEAATSQARSYSCKSVVTLALGMPENRESRATCYCTEESDYSDKMPTTTSTEA